MTEEGPFCAMDMSVRHRSSIWFITDIKRINADYNQLNGQARRASTVHPMFANVEDVAAELLRANRPLVALSLYTATWAIST